MKVFLACSVFLRSHIGFRPRFFGARSQSLHCCREGGRYMAEPHSLTEAVEGRRVLAESLMKTYVLLGIN